MPGREWIHQPPTMKLGGPGTRKLVPSAEFPDLANNTTTRRVMANDFSDLSLTGEIHRAMKTPWG